jgi:hypothetical protein
MFIEMIVPQFDGFIAGLSSHLDLPQNRGRANGAGIQAITKSWHEFSLENMNRWAVVENRVSSVSGMALANGAFVRVSLIPPEPASGACGPLHHCKSAVLSWCKTH